MKKIPSSVWLVLRLIFGALFIWSGIAKIKNPIRFTEDVRNYELIGDPFAATAALFIPWVEVIAGIAVMAGILFRGGVSILVASLVVFTSAVAISWARGLDITCGCFGSVEDLNYPVKISQNLGLILIGWVLWKSECDGNDQLTQS